MNNFAILDIFALLCFIAAAIALFIYRPRYTYDPQSKHWRRCIKCCQEQVKVCGGLFGKRWWETVGPIKQQDCSCHHDVD